MTDADLDRLEEVARAAPQGLYSGNARDVYCAPDGVMDGPGELYILATRHERYAAFAVYCSPPVVLALVAELREARRRCEGLAERVAAQSELLSRVAERQS